MSEFVVGVRVDGNTAGLAKAALEAKKALDNMAAAGAKDLDAIGQAAKKTEAAFSTMATRGQREFARMAQARETLGIRSEHRIQQEIMRTQAAYQRLVNSGTMSWREQRRAAEQMRETVGRLNAEMGVFTKGQRAAAGFRQVAVAGAAVLAGGAVIGTRASRAFSYHRELADVANTAYGDPSKSAEEDKAARFAGMRKAHETIVRVVDATGTTKEDALAGYKTLMGFGQFKGDSASSVYESAMRAAAANGAEGSAFMQLASSANSTLGVQAKDMPLLFGAATFAGQNGAFELRDMAMSLPKQFGFAQQLGMSGLTTAAKLAAFNQETRKLAGTSSEAATYAENYLSKLNANDTKTSLREKFGINLDERKVTGRMHGLDTLDVMGNILDEVLAKDKNYQRARKALEAAEPGSDRAKGLEDVLSIARGAAISKIFPDREAQMGAVAYVLGRKNISEMTADSLKFGGEAVDRNMWTLQSTPGFNISRAKEAADFANYEAMMKLAPVVSKTADMFADLAAKHPEMAAMMSGATTGLMSLAAAAGVSGLAGAIIGAKTPGIVGGAASGVKKGATALGNGAVGAATTLGVSGALAGAGLIAAPIAGAWLQDDMYRTEAGLRQRVADRQGVVDRFDRELAMQREGGFSPAAIKHTEDLRAKAVADRDAMNSRLQELLANTKIGGEVNVNITAAPGIQANADLQPNDGTRMTGNVGRTNVNTD
ncbi:phage tail tape measure protein [Achromobacter xylosoxidans]|uniref:phage tail tape measure protein n=1 Tax=Alcaligenes xylosoxydans xylosoxydans TaxID=85698 RepID=UPI001F0FE8A2|nr:phage tail tape measure protein [Achromobacter xylosoxidans]MCH4577561.1 phage tail tape measure protein [Achromobacter xylosoxidans]